MKYENKKHIRDEEGVAVRLYTHGDSAPHSHEFVELTYILEGEATHVVGGESMRVKPGDMFIIDLGVEHSYKLEEGKKITLCNCLFYPEFLTRAINGEGFIELAYDLFFSGYAFEGKEAKGFVSLLDADTSEIRGYILTMTEEQEKKKEGYLKVIRSLLTTVIIKMFRLCAEREHAPLPSFQRKLVGEVIDYIYAHDTKELSVGGISRAMFFSPSYLSRLFKQQTNLSLVKFIQEKKLETAASLLKGTNQSVDKIMAEVGYSDKKHFYDVFSRAYGMTPGEYRTKNT